MGDSPSRELGKRHPYPGEIAWILGQKQSFGAKPNLEPRPNLAPKPNLGPGPNLAPKPILAPKPNLEPRPNLAPKPVLAPKPNLGSRPILGPKPGGLRLGLGLDPKRKSVNPQAWKDAIGAKRVPARLALLPEAKPRWDRIGLSAGGQLTILAVLLLLPQIFPNEMNTALKYTYVELMQPVTEIPVAPEPPPPPPPKPPKIKAKVKVPPPKPKPVELEPKPVVPEPVPVKLNPTQPHIFMVLKPETPKVRTVDAKPIDLNPVLEVAKLDFPTTQPKRPKEEVKIENLGSGSTAPGTLVATANKVQTGGFGDPNGIAGPGNPNRAANINQAGSPLLPGGPGNGNGSGGANGMRGTVAEGPNKQALGKGGGNTPVSILDRPHPVYSDEGRTLRIEGDVILDVVFLASGQLQVNSVVSGLGHGLDQAAVQAAKQIHFKPATRDGHPVDLPARVRISFRVAA